MNVDNRLRYIVSRSHADVKAIDHDWLEAFCACFHLHAHQG